jgi:hypothetical protein
MQQRERVNSRFGKLHAKAPSRVLCRIRGTDRRRTNMNVTRVMRNPRTGETREVEDGASDRTLRNQGFVLKQADAGAAGGEADYETLTVDELKARAADAGLDVKRSGGEEGAPLKADYVRALKRHDRKSAASEHAG